MDSEARRRNVAVAFLTLFVALAGRKWFDAFLELVQEEAASALLSSDLVSPLGGLDEFCGEHHT